MWQGVNIGERRLLGPRLAGALMLEWFGLQLSPALISQTVHQAARRVAPVEAELARGRHVAVVMGARERQHGAVLHRCAHHKG